ncbi:hypothetical protein [Glycomyces buryatensis]|uniref:hypothetical protein n=1 Tax=Glycomyces buryatensis TaxID=2570927 RepID=UPI0014562D15|nr:hypothetical protein [Glycomyces buryatensis]
MAQRKFGPEYVHNFWTVLKEDLRHIEEVIIPEMKTGKLSFAPAFGLEGIDGKK